jgi:ferredoxin
MKQELSKDDLEVAEASVKFALENCPVEGLLSTPDGNGMTLEDIQDLLEQVKRVEDPSSGAALDDTALAKLEAVMEYTSQNCPVESVATYHDGRPISGKDIMKLAEELKE